MIKKTWKLFIFELFIYKLFVYRSSDDGQVFQTRGKKLLTFNPSCFMMSHTPSGADNSYRNLALFCPFSLILSGNYCGKQRQNCQNTYNFRKFIMNWSNFSTQYFSLIVTCTQLQMLYVHLKLMDTQLAAVPASFQCSRARTAHVDFSECHRAR